MRSSSSLDTSKSAPTQSCTRSIERWPDDSRIIFTFFLTAPISSWISPAGMSILALHISSHPTGRSGGKCPGRTRNSTTPKTGTVTGTRAFPVGWAAPPTPFATGSFSAPAGRYSILNPRCSRLSCRMRRSSSPTRACAAAVSTMALAPDNEIKDMGISGPSLRSWSTWSRTNSTTASKWMPADLSLSFCCSHEHLAPRYRQLRQMISSQVVHLVKPSDR